METSQEQPVTQKKSNPSVAVYVTLFSAAFAKQCAAISRPASRDDGCRQMAWC